ncbi:MAG: hypothetical protein ACMG6E_01160 [Candidatus Roizmanbacteria bacterium]
MEPQKLRQPERLHYDEVSIARTEFTTRGIELHLNRLSVEDAEIVRETVLFDSFVDVMQKAFAGVPITFQDESEQAPYDFLLGNYRPIIDDVISQDLVRGETGDFHYFPHILADIKEKAKKIAAIKEGPFWNRQRRSEADLLEQAQIEFTKGFSKPEHLLTYLYLDSLQVPLNTDAAWQGRVGLQISHDPYVIFYTAPNARGELTLDNEFASDYLNAGEMRGANRWSIIHITGPSNMAVSTRENFKANTTRAHLITSVPFADGRQKLKGLYSDFSQIIVIRDGNENPRNSAAITRSQKCTLNCPQWLKDSGSIVVYKSARLQSLTYNKSAVFEHNSPC